MLLSMLSIVYFLMLVFMLSTIYLFGLEFIFTVMYITLKSSEKISFYIYPFLHKLLTKNVLRYVWNNIP